MFIHLFLLFLNKVEDQEVEQIIFTALAYKFWIIFLNDSLTLVMLNKLRCHAYF